MVIKPGRGVTYLFGSEEEGTSAASSCCTEVIRVKTFSIVIRCVREYLLV